MRKIGDRTCPECGSIDVRRRGFGMNQRAENPIWCQKCNHTCDFKDLGERKETGGNNQSGLSKKLLEMDP